MTADSARRPDADRPPRVAVLGARTVVQGLGPYVARAFGAAGCEVTALLGTRPETTAAAVADLEQRFGLRTRGYTRLAELLAAERPDIVAVCTPWSTHRALLAELATAGVHVLCEKPLAWDPAWVRRSRRELEEETAGRLAGFVRGGKLLALNAQWPFALPAWRALFPGAAGDPPRRIELALAPVSRGAEQIVDAAPHLLSLLSALHGRGRVVAPVVVPRPPEGCRLSFRYEPLVPRHGVTAVEACLELERCERPPRPAALALDGVWASREIALPAYSMRFVEGRPARPGARSVPLPDPLEALVADFAAGVRAGRRTDADDLVECLGHLRDLVVAAQAAGAASLTESA